MDDLPDNVLLNKVTTGSGMTTLALTNSIKYVITVPYVNIILSKSEYPCLKVYAEEDSGVKYDDIIAYSGNKIICTYDSLPKVVSALTERGDISEWKLLIDECQKLVDAGSFRGRAIRGVLANYSKFKSYVFGTATPVPDKYQLPELLNIPKATICWQGLTPVSVRHSFYPKQLPEITTTIANRYLEGLEGKDNAHIFINSVTAIIAVVNRIKISHPEVSENIRIVCADNEYNAAKLETKLGKKFYISSVNSPAKKLNFYTATAFEGCDIFDKYGRTYIISDGSKDYAKIDILTTLPQIVGRLRDSIYKSEVELIYSASNYVSHVTEEEFCNEVLSKLAAAKATVEEYNIVSEGTRQLMLQAAKENSYFLTEDDNIEVNTTVWYSEMNAFHTLRELYQVNTKHNVFWKEEVTVNTNGIPYNYKKKEVIKITGINKAKLGKVPKFKDLCIDYINAMENLTSQEALETISRIDVLEPIIGKAYLIMGAKKIKAARYLKKTLLSLTNTEIGKTSIPNYLSAKLEIGKFYPSIYLKAMLADIYSEIGIPSTAKATDLHEWYELKEVNKKINGIQQIGFAIICPKTI
jgi:hypothetical protein